jgi:drug/metabolite transporter (DMT)-like permease
MGMKQIKSFAFLVVIAVVILWGITPVITKAIFNADDPSYSPGALIAMRGLFAIIAMAIVINKGFKKIDKSYWIAIPAGVILAAAYIFQFVGLKHTVPSKNTFLENISCITIPIFMYLFVKEKPTWASIVSALICAIGSVILIGKGFDFLHFFDGGTLLGDGLSAIGGLFFGLDIAFTKVFCKGKDPLLYVFIQLVVLTIVAFAYAFVFEGLIFNELSLSMNWIDLLQAMFLGVVGTAVAWAARAWAMKYISAVTVSVLVPLTAVVATVFSIALQMEEFTYNLLIGGIVVLISIVVSAVFDYDRDVHKNIVQPNDQVTEAQPNEQNPS